MDLETDEPSVIRTPARDFFAKQPFFTAEEFAAACSLSGRALERRLAYYVSTGDIMRVRRPLYASNHCDWDEYLLARRLAKDPVIAYESALAFHRLLPREYEFCVAAARSAPPVLFGRVEFRVVRNPLPPETAHSFTEEHDRYGEKIRVTSLARTLVDCLDRLEQGPGFIGTLEAFLTDPEVPIKMGDVLEYARLLGSDVAAARTSACLWAHPHWRGFTTNIQCALAALAPRRARYATPDMGKGEGSYINRCALIVPQALLSIAHRRK